MLRARTRLTLYTSAALLSVVGGWQLGFGAERAGAGSSAAFAIDSLLLRSYRWRSIGPDRGGRSIGATGVKGRPREAYFGATGGGLWKTTDGGSNWTPLTDFITDANGQGVPASIGAMAVSFTFTRTPPWSSSRRLP